MKRCVCAFTSQKTAAVINMLDEKVDPQLPTKSFATQAFRVFQRKLPLVQFGTHAGLSILLEYLLELSERHASVERWFRCPEPLLEAELGMIPATQQRLIKLLESIRYIESKQVGGSSPARYLRANFDIVESDFRAAPPNLDAER